MGFNAAVRVAPRVTFIPTVLRVHSINTRGRDWLVGLSLDLALGGGGHTDE